MPFSFIALFVAVLGAVLGCGNAFASAEALPLEVAASVPVKVKGDKWSLKYALVNRGTKTVSFAVFSCSVWENWKTDGNEFFIPPGGCRANILAQRDLEPGKKLIGELEVRSAPNLKAGEHTFHLIFVPFNITPFGKKELAHALTPIPSHEIKVRLGHEAE